MERSSKDYIKDLVSVITPVYNCEKHVEDMLLSVFAQTYKNIEIVMVDDNSIDGSVDIIRRYQQEHPELIYYF